MWTVLDCCWQRAEIAIDSDADSDADAASVAAVVPWPPIALFVLR